MVIASATDVTSGARFYFTQTMFDILCADLAQVRLSRAAASSSAVPVVLSPVTFNNYGGTCGYREPPWLNVIANPAHPVRPAARTMRYFDDLRAYEDSKERPFIHVVDGGVGDNLGLRGVLDVLDQIEALKLVGLPTPLDGVKRVAFVIVNSLSTPSTDFNKREAGPGVFYQFMQSTSVPIDHYSFEAIELLRDIAARWRTMRAIRDSGAIRDAANPALREVERVPNADLYVIEVSFSALRDATLRARAQRAADVVRASRGGGRPAACRRPLDPARRSGIPSLPHRYRRTRPLALGPVDASQRASVHSVSRP